VVVDRQEQEETVAAVRVALEVRVVVGKVAATLEAAGSSPVTSLSLRPTHGAVRRSVSRPKSSSLCLLADRCTLAPDGRHGPPCYNYSLPGITSDKAANDS